jgi:hypothetical protein
MTAQPTPPATATPAKRRRWILLGIAAFFLIFALLNAIDPFGDKGYVGISHGDHTHYVPEDRDPDVSISNFPGEPPGPNERILPDGRVVPRN